MKFRNKKIKLNPIMSFLVLIIITIVLSGILYYIGFESTYYTIDPGASEYQSNLVTVDPLLNLSGLKYIFSSTVSNFVSFTPLSTLIISLIGIGIMEKSGFLKAIFTLLTRRVTKNTITFSIVLIAVLSSIVGNLGYVTLIPISALLFLHGRRNPIIGIVATYAGLTAGTGISLFFTSVDSQMLTQTLSASSIFGNFSLDTFIYLGIMAVTIIIVTTVITFVTEKIVSEKVKRYEFKEEKKEYKLGKKEYRGLLLAGFSGLIYLLIFTYCIIPNLPFSGTLLDHSQTFYIDKLFSPESFFSAGFVFIITIFFIILGLFYGLGARSIKNHNEFCEDLSHSLDGTGRMLILILFASVLINIFKASNMGIVIISYLGELLNNANFTGIPLIILLFIIGAISNIFVTSGTTKWAILSVVAVPAFMNAGLSPELSQLVFRFSEGVTAGITPLLAYFVIYLGFIEKYNQDENPVGLFESLKYQLPYSLIIGMVLILILTIWYISGIPLGIGGSTII